MKYSSNTQSMKCLTFNVLEEARKGHFFAAFYTYDSDLVVVQAVNIPIFTHSICIQHVHTRTWFSIEKYVSFHHRSSFICDRWNAWVRHLIDLIELEWQWKQHARVAVFNETIRVEKSDSWFVNLLIYGFHATSSVNLQY